MADELRAAPWHGSRGGGAVNCDHEPWARSKQAMAAQCVIDDSNGEGEGTLLAAG
jgi:hypothetical protein